MCKDKHKFRDFDFGRHIICDDCELVLNFQFNKLPSEFTVVETIMVPEQRHFKSMSVADLLKSFVISHGKSDKTTK